MEKKQEKVEVPVVETPVVETPKPKRKEPTNEFIKGWEFKDRTYVLSSGNQPLSYAFRSRNMFWFDKEKGYEREIAYATNQRTPFVDEFAGRVIPGRIIFRYGVLNVPKEKVILQKILSIYHPQANKSWYEVKPAVAAQDEVEVMELEIEALMAARDMDLDLMEAIVRTEVGTKVSSMSSKELKRDALIFAKKKPQLFLDLMNDGNVHLRNLAIKAVEQNLIKLSGDQRTVTWASNGRKLLNVPFDEHPYSAIAAWFKTDEGMEIYANIEKRLK